MATAKVTKRDNFEAIKAVLEGLGETELAGVMGHELELLAKRAGKERGMTATQKENEVVKDFIVEALTGAEAGVTATEVATIAEVSVQKATQLLKQLVTEGRVARTEGTGKEKTTFAVV